MILCWRWQPPMRRTSGQTIGTHGRLERSFHEGKSHAGLQAGRTRSRPGGEERTAQLLDKAQERESRRSRSELLRASNP